MALIIVMLNRYSQWLNVKGKKIFYRDISIDISDAVFQS